MEFDQVKCSKCGKEFSRPKPDRDTVIWKEICELCRDEPKRVNGLVPVRSYKIVRSYEIVKS
jgi:hypothetical protein